MPNPNYMRLFLTVAGLACCVAGHAQTADNGPVVEVAGSVFFNSARLSSINGEQGIYKEVKLGYRFKKPFEIDALVGHQWRSYIYYRVPPQGGLSPLFIHRDFVPVAVNFRVYLTDYFVNTLGLFRRREKWDVYNQIMLVRLYGKDTRDPLETPQDQIIYSYPYIHEYGKVYVGFMAGLAYRPTPHTAIFLEGGDGAIATFQIGVRAKL